MKKLSFLAAMLFFVASLFAQVPEKMTYQAVVRDNNNHILANVNVGVRISILQGSATGTALYSETHVVSTNIHGLMTISIGDGTVETGSFSAIDWANGPYFLKTETDPNGGTSYSIEGTQQLQSVPYALHAKTTENVFSGDYNDLTNKPTIPTVPANVSAFTNDAGYINNTSCPELTFCDLATTLSTMQNQVVQLQQQVAQQQHIIDSLPRNVVGIPTVSTAIVTNITLSSATCGGEVTADGGVNITTRGVCWSTSQNPTLSDNYISVILRIFGLPHWGLPAGLPPFVCLITTTLPLAGMAVCTTTVILSAA